MHTVMSEYVSMAVSTASVFRWSGSGSRRLEMAVTADPPRKEDVANVCDLFYANLNEISNVIGNLHYFTISIAIVNDIRKLNAF